MGFSSLDDFISKVTASGQFWRTDWNKLTHHVTAQAAGEWYALTHSLGNPGAMALTAGTTNLAFQSVTDQYAGAIQHGGIVTPATKHILNASAFSAAATTMPAILMLVDLLGFYPMNTCTSTGNQAAVNAVTATFANATDVMTTTGYDIANLSRFQLTNSGGAVPAGLALLTDYWTIRQSASTSKIASSLANAIAATAIDFTTDGTGTTTCNVGLPRYTTGAGVQCFVTPRTAAMGSATPNMQITYTSPSGTGHVTPATLPIGKTGAPIGLVCYSGTGAGKYGPFMPLAAGDTGITKLEQMSLSVSYAVADGLAWCLCRPLLTLPMTTIGVASERDLLNQMPSLPRVYDGACLAWLIYAGANTPIDSGFYGHIDFGWSA